MNRISLKAAANPGRTRLLLVAFFAILISIPILSQCPDRAAQFRRMSEEAEKKGLAEPFKGITTDGNVAPGLFPIQATGVSTASVRNAAEAFLASLSNVQELTTRLRPLLDSLNTTTARANDTLGHVDATLMENRPDIRAAVTGLRDTLAKSTGLLTELNQTLDQNSANIDDLLDNIRMSTENLRTLTETLMHSPASLIRGIKVPDRKPGDVRK